MRRSLLLVLFGCAVRLYAQSVPNFAYIDLPDDQYLSSGCDVNQLGSMPLWVQSNTSTLNIKGLLSVGDDVDTSDSAQWTCYVNDLLDVWQSDDAGVFYLSAIGNHGYEGDTPGATPDPSRRVATSFAANILAVVTAESQYQGAWTPGDGSQDPEVNYWVKHTVGTQTYGVIVLEFCPRAAAVAWANGIMQANPTVYFAVWQHAGLLANGQLGTSGSSGTSGCYASGVDGVNDPAAYGSNDIWNVLKGNKNWYLDVGGHYAGAAGDYTAHDVLVGTNGNHVTFIYDNHQYDANSAWMGIIQIQPSLHQIAFSDYNNYLSESGAAPVYQFTTQYDDLTPPASSPNAGIGGAAGAGGAAAIQ